MTLDQLHALIAEGRAIGAQFAPIVEERADEVARHREDRQTAARLAADADEIERRIALADYEQRIALEHLPPPAGSPTRAKRERQVKEAAAHASRRRDQEKHEARERLERLGATVRERGAQHGIEHLADAATVEDLDEAVTAVRTAADVLAAAEPAPPVIPEPQAQAISHRWQQDVQRALAIVAPDRLADLNEGWDPLPEHVAAAALEPGDARLELTTWNHEQFVKALERVTASL